MSDSISVSRQRGLFLCEYESVGKEQSVKTNRHESYVPNIKSCFMEKAGSGGHAATYMLVTEFENSEKRYTEFFENKIGDTDTLRMYFRFRNGAGGTFILVKRGS